MEGGRSNRLTPSFKDTVSGVSHYFEANAYIKSYKMLISMALNMYKHQTT